MSVVTHFLQRAVLSWEMSEMQIGSTFVVWQTVSLIMTENFIPFLWNSGDMHPG